MVTIVSAAHLAAAAPTSMIPDLSQRLHPSDSTPWTILLVLTLITLLPAILMCMTPLVRLLVVFHFLRQALGTQTAPSNPTLMGLALMMTWFLMAPVLNQVDQQAVEPYRSGQVTGWEAIDRGAQPVKLFLLRYAREKDLALFTSAGQIPRPNQPTDLPMRVVVPAYILSELKAGFAIGAVLFLPFLLIDMVPPVHISDNLRLKPREYIFSLRGIEIGRWQTEGTHMLAVSGEAGRRPLTGKDTREPAFGVPAIWISPAIEDQAIAAGYSVVDAVTVITTHLGELIRQHAWELLGRAETKRLMDSLNDTHPKLLEELVPKLLTLGEVEKVLEQLLRERVSIRDMGAILEALIEAAPVASSSSTRLAALNTMQALFTPDSGSTSSTAGDIGSDLTSFFSSFSSLEANPTNNALRQDVLSTASTLAGDISNAAGSLNSQRTALDEEAAGVTSQVNSLTSAIAQLNQQIESTSPNADAGTLEDQRQQDLSQLSQLIGINKISTENNGLEITTTSGQLLLSGGTSVQMTSGVENGVTNFYLGGINITKPLASGGGQLGGYLTARDGDIPTALTSLDQLAYSVSTQVNALNNAGTDLDGVSGTVTAPLNIFSQPTAVSGSASTMSVVMTDPNQIATAGSSDDSGDNSNAVAMASLARQPIVNGQTPTDYYSNFVTTLGATVSGVQTENTAQNASVTQLQTQNDAISSVNLDDEASSMTTLERSYQAASQVFSMLNTIMASALNLGDQTTVS